NVILEAAAAGLPIVTWDLPFYQEILENGKTGLLVEAGNVEKLEEAVTRLIESPQLRAQLGAEAQARILREFSLERYIRSMTAAYDELLNNPPAGASGNP
ncbi:MAG: glycosyltransferase family 4 protein, partial [Chloroflexi bacterium]|nr:glycosyltransferase family 4 protein [Chloroflexota bacterium]